MTGFYLTGKSSPITGPRCPEGSRKLRSPWFRDNGTWWW